MQIRSQLEYDRAKAELAALNITKRGQELRLDELVEAIEAWSSVTGVNEPRRDVRIGDKVQMSFAFPDASGAGDYRVVRMLPPTIDGEAQYRVEDANGRERVVGANQIRPSFDQKPAKRRAFDATGLPSARA